MASFLPRKRRGVPGLRLLITIGTAFFAAWGVARAEDAKPRTTGLPSAVDWTFNLKVGLGAFGFNDSLYRNVRPDPSGDLSDNWFEAFAKPAISGEYPVDGSVFFGQASAVGSRTFSAPPSSLVGDEASAFDIEDLYLGWRSGTALGATEDMFSLTLGRAPYQLGHGMILADGAGDGGSRGGFWSGARKAWEKAGIGRMKLGPNTFEFFYLDREELPENDSHNKVYGANYEFTYGETFTVGLSYLQPKSNFAPRDEMDVYDARLFAAPLPMVPALSVELEYVHEENGNDFEAAAWYAQVGYELTTVNWTPRLTYRYAFFEGDDPDTEKSEAFDSLFPGFYDWGTWWQGEIAGEYFLANSNLISHQLRLHAKPTKKLSGGLMGFLFELDQPSTFSPGVTSDKVGYELDLYLDWAHNDNFSTSIVVAYADPDDAIQQTTGRTSHLEYAMVYVTYSY